MEDFPQNHSEKDRLAWLEIIMSKNIDGILQLKNVYNSESYEVPLTLQIWKKSYIWSSIYNSCYIDDPDFLRECIPVWTGTKIKLFKVSTDHNSVINSV